MSTAILMSGQFRTFKQCLPTQHWHVYRHFPDCHFFLVMQKTLPKALTPNAPDPINSEAMVKLLEDKYGKERVHAKLIDDPTNLPMIRKEFGAYAPYFNTAAHPQLMMQHWYQNEVWKWFCQNSAGGQFDTIIRMRGDNFFKTYEAPKKGILERIFSFLIRFAAFLGFHDSEEKPTDKNRTVYSPWWGRFGGINDRFAIMDYAAAGVYFTLYEKIDELIKLGCPFHPETILKAHLEREGVVSDDTLDAVYDTYRVNGNHRPAESEMLPGDIATAPRR